MPIKFNCFLNSVSNISKAKLNKEAHFKMMPSIRKNIAETTFTSAKKAAVLILFYPDKNKKTHFILTKRASYKGVHSAQISFPGGKQDKRDISLQQTALRETFEEIGVVSSTIHCFKQLSNVFIPPSNFLVTPFIGYTTSTPIFKLNYEVTNLINVSITDLLNPKNISKTSITNSYAINMEVPCFNFNQNIVWGATAMILSELRELL